MSSLTQILFKNKKNVKKSNFKICEKQNLIKTGLFLGFLKEKIDLEIVQSSR